MLIPQLLVIPQYCKRNTVLHIQYPLTLVTVRVTIARFEAVTSTYKSIVELTAWILEAWYTKLI